MAENQGTPSTFGARLADRIADAVIRATVDTRSRMAPVAKDVATQVFTDVTNHVSDEVRAAMGAVFRRVADDPATPAEVRPLFHHLGRTRGQAFGWIGGAATGAAMSSGLGDLFTNTLAPVVSSIIAENPNAYMSPEQAATIEARGIGAGWNNYREAARRGVSGDRFERLVRLSQRDLTQAEVYELHNRGALSEQDAIGELVKGGMSHESATLSLNLAKVPLTAQEAAQAWARNLVSEAEVGLSARAAGLSGRDAQTLMGLAGEPPNLETLILAWRRGIITESDVDRGIVQGPIRNEWIPTVKALQEEPLSPSESASAVTQGHLTYEQGQSKAALFGITPEDFRVLVENSGIPPGIEFMAEARNRGLITEEEWERTFLESRIKNIYIETMRKMRQRLISAETVRLMYRHGVYPLEAAVETLIGHGFTDVDARAQLELEDIRAREGTKDLTRSQILDLFEEDIITAEQASAMLIEAGFDAVETEWLLTLSEGNKVKRFVNAVITRVRNSYVSGNIDQEEAASLLDRVGVGVRQRDNLLSLWELERESRSAQLTPAQIVSAVKKGLLTEADGKDRLVVRGYTETDAEILIRLSVPA